MGRGTLDTGLLRAEQHDWQVRTTDPAGTQEGHAWVRSDLAPETDQIATLRFDRGASTVDIPIFNSAASVTNVKKVWRVQVGGVTGFIPLAASGETGAYDFLKFQHAGNALDAHSSTDITAFFDVAITSTNDPITAGDTLDVNYDVSNTGNTDDTQDITLEIDGIQEDSNQNVTLSDGQTVSDVLNWITISGEAGHYTATVLSDDDTDSVTVTVESAIPDSVVSRPDDNATTSTFDSNGHVISPASTFSGVGARISNNTSGVTRARLYDYGSGAYIETVDISGLSAGDAFAFGSDIVQGQEYGIEIDAEGGSYTDGYNNDNNNDATNYPYSGVDLDIVAQSRDGSQSTSNVVQAIDDIGNPDNILP